ncbi:MULTISPECIES: universal stress protein [unclassified Roseofilum]|uniref:universal stress protein n=1 Tax=unclassified Roseofilum TaxID=2620099 RepID=UPI000E96F82E|nr:MULTISPECIES: universal stress protein [unclassified Roseofilum]MBP0007369.1 universal stress protein [Roseofilum sp. Belize Diploria]MBP0033464.1 universal stress protein [Roseofilum sp. Belize BBD 4]HBQ99804.1 universal stress protein [Cyanobacteria bacterium UBA11691]
MVYQKILVALDRSLQAETVFEKGLALAQQFSSQMMLFHRLGLEESSLFTYVGPYGHTLTNFSQAVQEQMAEETEQTRQWLSCYCDRAQEAGVSCEWEWKMGDTGRWICDLAKSWGADLIVVGRRGRHEVAEVLLGSVSNYVVHRASCSVFIVQDKPLLSEPT